MAVVKGASDGGLYVPHNEKNFAGYSKEDKKFEAEVMQGRITGEHVADYMTEMLDESPEKYQQLFGSKGIEKKNTRWGCSQIIILCRRRCILLLMMKNSCCFRTTTEHLQQKNWISRGKIPFSLLREIVPGTISKRTWTTRTPCTTSK